MTDSKIRSTVKTVTWRLVGSGSTFIISWWLSGNLKVSGSIATIQLLTNTVLYYIHERGWATVKWGTR